MSDDKGWGAPNTWVTMNQSDSGATPTEIFPPGVRGEILAMTLSGGSGDNMVMREADGGAVAGGKWLWFWIMAVVTSGSLGRDIAFSPGAGIPFNNGLEIEFNTGGGLDFAMVYRLRDRAVPPTTEGER